MNIDIFGLVVGILACSFFVGGLFYLDYWMRKKEKEKHSKKTG